MTKKNPNAMTRAEAAVLARAARAKNIPPLHIRFWSKVEKKSEDECWPWIAAVRNKKQGYGAFWLDGRHQPSNRVALILSDTDVPEGMVACHKCDNPNCCNPKHLFVGSRMDNEIDKVTKRRHAHGERNGNSILTAQQVAEIRSHRPTGVAQLKRGTPEMLSKKYGISKPYVSELLTRGWGKNAHI